jgi:hypothetical protein
MGDRNALSGLRHISRLVHARAWAATIAASIITTYALDFVATSAGLLVVASGWLAGITHWQALGLLFATYLVWGAGLWAMMLANWELLRHTGTSANILSKVAHDLVARLTASPRWRRIAAHVGFMATELAKEAPYYFGAAGAALFSESISAIDAIIFLVGANMGAAAYGFTLAHGVRLFARRVAERQPNAPVPVADADGASIPAVEEIGDDRSALNPKLPPLLPRG